MGALDTDFGTSGLITTDVPGNNDISSRVKVQDDGKIVLGGRCDEGPLPIMFLSRYDTTGVIDSDFGIDGIALSDINCLQPSPIFYSNRWKVFSTWKFHNNCRAI